MKSTTVPVLFALVLSIAMPASAITVSGSSDTNAAVGTGSGIGIDVSSQTDVEVGAGAGASTSVSQTGIGATIGGETDLMADTGITVTSAAAVQSETELDVYTANVMRENANIRDIAVSETTVSVSHREHARIFGIFPTTVFARATVMSDGSISVKYPWYAFASAKASKLEAKVSGVVRSMMPSASANAEASANFSAQTQARVLEQAIIAMQSEFEADAAAQAQVN